MPNAQEWLDKSYPKEIRNLIVNLYIREKKLERGLDLRDFSSLEKLDCCFNQITSLNLTGLKNLKVLYANDNLLTNLNYSSLDPKNLTGLIIDNNNLSEQNIDIFRKFRNLTELSLANNRFFGSLQSLKDLEKLERLGLLGTDVNEGREYLPEIA